MDDDSFADEEGGLDLFAWRLTSLLHNEFVDTGLSISQLPRQFQKVWGCGLPNPRDHGCGRKMIHLLRKLPQAVRVVNTSNTHTMLYAPLAGAVALSVGGVGGMGGVGGVGGARSSEGGGGRDAGGGGVGAVAVSAASAVSAAQQVGKNSGKRKMEAEQEDNSNTGGEAGVSVDEARQLRRAERREEKKRKKATAATKRKDHPHLFPSGGGDGGGGCPL